MVSTSMAKAVNKRITVYFTLDKNFDSTIEKAGFVKKVHFHYTKKPLSPAGISKTKNRRKWLPTVVEKLFYKNSFTSG